MSQRGDRDEDLTLILNQRDITLARAEQAFGRHYDSLRLLARQLMRSERPDHTLEPTALVHEAFLRLADQERITERGSRYFKGCIASECRRILVDHERKRRAGLRGGGRRRTCLDTGHSWMGTERDVELLELSDLIEELRKRNARIAQVVDMRVFGGLTIAETAEVMGVSERSVSSYWSFAQTWLRRELAP